MEEIIKLIEEKNLKLIDEMKPWHKGNIRYFQLADEVKFNNKVLALLKARAGKPDADTESGLHLQNVNASALIAERRKYKLEEIWNCNYEDLSDHEKFIIDNETQTLESFFDWLHSR